MESIQEPTVVETPFFFQSGDPDPDPNNDPDNPPTTKSDRPGVKDGSLPPGLKTPPKN